MCKAHSMVYVVPVAKFFLLPKRMKSSGAISSPGKFPDWPIISAQQAGALMFICLL